jgi:hypothetical protein
MDAPFRDRWLIETGLKDALVPVLEQQLAALAEAGIPVGVELNRIPSPGYLEFLREMCRKGIVTVVGVNGLEELPGLVLDSELNRGNRLIDPAAAPPALRGELQAVSQGQRFEYLTYLRGRGLAEWLGVKILYVHTNDVDLVLQRDASENDLSRAQLACMCGKCWVNAALLVRGWPEAPFSQLERLAPAAKPEGMARLARFVRHMAYWDGLPEGDVLAMLDSGRRASRPGSRYGVAAAPVLWPSDHFSRRGGRPGLPMDFNTTGAGDMTFAAFLLFLGS